jgi:hypothetical protein
MKTLISTLLCLIFSYNLYSQHLILRDKEGKQVNNDTVEVLFYPTGNHGWTEITSEIYIENTTDDTLAVGFRKVQYNPIKAQEYHSFCFAGFCFDSSTYIAPYPTIILPKTIDSSFSGHYRFDDLLHEPGTYLVSYQFYNVNDSLDTATVYVIYNTLHQVEIEENTAEISNLNAFPNPAIDQITIAYQLPNNSEDYYLFVTNVFGQCIYQQSLHQEKEAININTKGWTSGMYVYRIVRNNKTIVGKKFLIKK